MIFSFSSLTTKIHAFTNSDLFGYLPTISGEGFTQVVSFHANAWGIIASNDCGHKSYTHANKMGGK